MAALENTYNLRFFVEVALMSIRNYSVGSQPWTLQSTHFQPRSNVSCDRSLGGWRYDVDAACTQSSSGGQATTVLSLHVVANKTACFTVHNPTATTIRLAGNITMKTTRAAPRSSKKGPPSGTPAAATPAFCSKAALLKAGFPERVARRGYKTMNVAQTNSRSMLVEPAMRIFNTWYMSTGQAASCGSHTPSNAPRADKGITLQLLAGCKKDVTVKSKYGHTQAGSSFAVQFLVRKTCAKSGKALNVVLAGDVSQYSMLPRFEKVDEEAWPTAVASPPRVQALPAAPPPLVDAGRRRGLLSCSTGCAKCNGPNSCNECQDGYAWQGGGTCIACPAGCSACATSTICEACKNGYWLDGPTCVPCTMRGCAVCPLGICPSPPPPSPPPPSPPPPAVNPGCSAEMGCYISTSTLANTVNTFPKGPTGKPYFSMPLLGTLEDVLASFNPDAFLQAAQYVGAKSVCQLTVLGSSLAADVAPSGPLNFISNAVVGAADLMSTLPVQGDVYYLVGQYATGIPGLSDDLPAMAIAAAINPCIGDYFFVFNGLEVQVPVEFAEISVALTGLGFSRKAALISDSSVAVTYPSLSTSSSATFINSQFWTPMGERTLAIRAQLWMQATSSMGIGSEKMGCSVEMDATGNVLINYDPLNDGTSNGNNDNQLMISGVGSPTINLPNSFQISLAGYSTATTTLFWSYFSDSNYTLAINCNAYASLSNFFSTAFPWLPSAVTVAMNAAFPSSAEELDVYVSNAAWGVRIETGVAGGMNELTAIYDFLALLFNWPTTVDVSFSVSGSMTGDGLPIAVDLTAGGESITLIFCRSSSDCPSSYQCNLGVCSQLASCPPAHPHMYGLLCYSECQSGWSMLVAGICYAPCASGYKDGGLVCTGCPSGDYDDAGLCYPNCRSGYTGVGPVCWSNCPSGYTDTGCCCTRPDSTYGKSCCCVYGTETHCNGGCWSDCACGLTTTDTESCCNNCDSGYTDTGCTCEMYSVTDAKSSYGNGVGSPDTLFKASEEMTPYPLCTNLPANPYFG